MKKFPLRRNVVISTVLLTVTLVLFAYANDKQGHFTPLDRAKTSRSELLDNVLTKADGSACTEPCMFGVFPGKTLHSAVPALLRSHAYFVNHFSAREDKPGVYKATTSDIFLTFYGGAGDVVNGAQLGPDVLPWELHTITPPSPMPTLGQIIFTLGNPKHILFITGPAPPSYAVYFNYPELNLQFAITYSPSGVMTPDDYTFLIAIDPPNRAAELNEGGPWLGFGSIQNYLQRKDTVLTKVNGN